MPEATCNQFQSNVSEFLLRHKSILDVLSKYQESCAKVNRAIIKSATTCGCIQINAKKQDIPEEVSYKELNEYMSTHLEGNLCEICRDKVEKELGNHLFYLTAICSTLDLNLEEILKQQTKSIRTLGKFSLY